MGSDDPAAVHDRFAGREYPQPEPVTDGVRECCEVREERVLGHTMYTLTPRRHASGWHIVYTHGAGFVHPLRTMHWDIIEALVRHTGASIRVPIYPLAPEHPYTEAFRLLEQVYRGLLNHAPASRIVLCGDSSGGHLALGQALHYRDEGLPPPALIVLFSPVLDATMSNPEMAAIADRDPVLRISTARRYFRWWAGSADLHTPLLSPISADLRGLPPLEVFVGTEEILLPDVRLLRDRVAAAGGRIRLHETPGAIHGFMATTSSTEATRVYRQIARTLDDLGATPGAQSLTDVGGAGQGAEHHVG
jgi:acetyl esterase/lipase